MIENRLKSKKPLNPIVATQMDIEMNIAEIRELSKTMTKTQIANKFGWKAKYFLRSTRSKWFLDFKISFPDGRTSAFERHENFEQIIKREFQDNLSNLEIAEKYGFGESTVRAWRQKLGLTRPYDKLAHTKKKKKVGFAANHKTVPQIIAAENAKALKEFLKSEQRRELIATGGDIAALGDYRAKYGPKVGKTWTMKDMVQMYQDAKDTK